MLRASLRGSEAGRCDLENQILQSAHVYNRSQQIVLQTSKGCTHYLGHVMEILIKRKFAPGTSGHFCLVRHWLRDEAEHQHQQAQQRDAALPDGREDAL